MALIPVTLSGADEAAAGLDLLSGGLQRAGEASREFQSATNQAVEGIARFDSRISALGQVMSGFGRVVRSETITAVGDFTRSIAASATAGAQAGAVFGPQGAFAGAILGAAIPAIDELIGSLEGVLPAQEDVAESTLEAAGALREEEAAAYDAASALSSFLNAVSTSGRRQELAELGEEIANVTDELERARGSSQAMERLRAGVGGDLSERLSSLTRQASELRAELEAEDEELRNRGQPGAFGQQQRGGSGERDREGKLAEEASWLDTIRGIEGELNSRAAERLSIEEKLNEQRQISRLLIETRDAEERALHENAMERMRAQQEADDEAEAANRERYARSRDATREYAEMVGNANGLFIDAITETIAGTKSAEDAFKGLLSAFLEMIAKEAALKAAFEYGEAIASFARYDYASGGQHLAAGVAYTAVAIAAGVGAAVTAPSSAQPVEPDRNSDTGAAEQQPGQTVINWYAPVYTSQQRAEMGRELGGLIEAGRSRYG